jgi:hypothetical protein
MKDDIKRFRRFCRINKMSDEERYEFSAHLHGMKESGAKGSAKNGDFTWDELKAILKGFRREGE